MLCVLHFLICLLFYFIRVYKLYKIMGFILIFSCFITVTFLYMHVSYFGHSLMILMPSVPSNKSHM